MASDLRGNRSDEVEIIPRTARVAWTPSLVRLSSFLANESHASEACAVFHLAWIDNRTGVLQVWTTTVPHTLRSGLLLPDRQTLLLAIRVGVGATNHGE